MPVSNNETIIDITSDALSKMPKAMARRLKPGLRKGMLKEFDEWIDDMGYRSFKASPVMRQLLFEAFIGGWGARNRNLKRKKLDNIASGNV